MLRRFLQSFAEHKGFVFEEILEELFGKADRTLHVDRKGGVKDGGVDLELSRDSGLTGREQLLVQAKCTTSRIGPQDVQAFHGVCVTRACRGIIVSLGGFTSGAESFAKQAVPAIHLLGPTEINDLLWRHLTEMPLTSKWFGKWCKSVSDDQGALF